jgi:hypothetical protein
MFVLLIIEQYNALFQFDKFKSCFCNRPTVIKSVVYILSLIFSNVSIKTVPTITNLIIQLWEL